MDALSVVFEIIAWVLFIAWAIYISLTVFNWFMGVLDELRAIPIDRRRILNQLGAIAYMVEKLEQEIKQLRGELSLHGKVINQEQIRDLDRAIRFSKERHPRDVDVDED